MNKITLLTLSLLVFNGHLIGQENSIIPEQTITLEKAISIALENNHSIIIAKNTTEINTNNATIGNAGLLPTVTASGSYSGSVNDAEFQIINQQPITVNNAKTKSTAGSLGANYLLFDGFENYYRFKSLKTLQEQAGVQSRLQIEGTLLQVISFYMNVLTQKRNLEISRESIDRSLERLNRFTKSYELGKTTRLEFLSAQVDLNSDSVIFVQSEAAYENSKRDLLIQLGADPESDIQIIDNIRLNESLKVDDLLMKSLENNAAVVLSKLTAENVLLSLKQNRSSRFPKINLNGSYDYFRSESDASQLEFQQSTGFSGGISISLNLFNGFKQEIQIQNAQVELKNNQEALFLAEKSLKRDVLNTYKNYQTNLFLLNKEALNLETAELNFERSKQLFELGQVTNTQFREAQLNVSRVQQNILRLQVQAKLSEVSLYQLSGQLIETE